jgi:hypothetical protein
LHIRRCLLSCKCFLLLFNLFLWRFYIVILIGKGLLRRSFRFEDLSFSSSTASLRDGTFTQSFVRSFSLQRLWWNKDLIIWYGLLFITVSKSQHKFIYTWFSLLRIFIPTIQISFMLFQRFIILRQTEKLLLILIKRAFLL